MLCCAHSFSVYAIVQECSLWCCIRLLQYIKEAPGQGLLLRTQSDFQLYAFCDSDWASCPLIGRSLTGYFVLLGMSPISWKTKKWSTISRSTDETEYRAMPTTTSELFWLLSSLLLAFSIAIPCNYIVTIKLHFILLTIMFFMSIQNTLKLIVAMYVNKLLTVLFPPLMFNPIFS